MITAKQYRAKAAEYAGLLKAASLPAEIHEFRRLEQSYLMLAENEEWMAHNREKISSPGADKNWYGYVNATGPARLAPVLHAKQLKLARELVPAAALIGVLINPDSPKAELLLSDVQTAARTIGQSIHILNASSEGDLENAFAIIIAQHVGALVVTSDAFFNSQFDRIVELAARHHVPTIYNGASIPSGRGARLLRDFICLSLPQTQN